MQRGSEGKDNDPSSHHEKRPPSYSPVFRVNSCFSSSLLQGQRGSHRGACGRCVVGGFHDMSTTSSCRQVPLLHATYWTG